jgi:hypothetical protein
MAGADILVPWRHPGAEENRSGQRASLISLRFFRLTSLPEKLSPAEKIQGRPAFTPVANSLCWTQRRELLLPSCLFGAAVYTPG